MIVEYDLTVDDVIAQKLSHDRHSTAVQQSRLGILWIPTVFFLLFAAALWVFEIKRNPNSLGPSQDVAVIFGLGVLYFWTVLSLFKFYVPFRLRRTVRRMFAKGENKGLFGPQRVTVGPEGVLTENASGATSQPWLTIEEVAVAEDGVSLSCNGTGAVIVPRRVFSSEAEFGAFVETVQQYVHPVVSNYSVSPDGQITLEYELTQDDLVAFGLYGLRQSEVLRSYLWNNLFGLVMLLMFPVLVCVCVDSRLSHFLQTAGRHWVLFLIAPASALICLVDWKFFYPQRLRGYLADYYSECRGFQKVTVKPEGLLAETSSAQVLYFWGSFKKVEVMEAYAYLYVESTSAFIIPRRIFSTGDEFDKFVETIHQFMQKSTSVA